MPRQLLLAEELALLTYDRNSGKSGIHPDYALSGLLLIELVLMSRLRITDSKTSAILDYTPTGDPELDWALQRIANEQDGKYDDLVSTLTVAGFTGKTNHEYPLKNRIMNRLIRDNIVARSEKKVFGIFRSVRYTTVDHEKRDYILASIADAYVKPPVRDPRVAGFLLAAHACFLNYPMIAELDTLPGVSITAEAEEDTKKEIHRGSEWGTRDLRDQLRHLERAITACRTG